MIDLKAGRQIHIPCNHRGIVSGGSGGYASKCKALVSYSVAND